MKEKLTHIEFYFPKQEKVKSKQELADLIVEEMRMNDSIGYSGHADEEGLREGIVSHLGDTDVSEYETLSDNQKENVIKVIEETVDKCNKKLSVPIKNYVFVYPWFPTEDFEMFEGVMGVARYSCVFHIFLSPSQWTPNVLANSVAHELNHTIFYYHHYDNFNAYNLLDELMMEGLAENFREDVIDSEESPWSSALTKDEAFSILKSLKDSLDSKDEDLIRDVLFGNEIYKRWTGYSVGYWVVKSFIEKNAQLSWDEIMKKESQEFVAGL